MPEGNDLAIAACNGKSKPVEAKLPSQEWLEKQFP
jgi:hypothetical protein